MAVVEPVESAGRQPRRLRLRSPATLDPLGEIEVLSSDEMDDAAVETARKAQPEWAGLTCDEGGPLRKARRARAPREPGGVSGDSRYGLNASVWTRNKQEGVEIARALESGAVVVDDCMVTYGVTESPFGGVKESGIRTSERGAGAARLLSRPLRRGGSLWSKGRGDVVPLLCQGKFRLFQRMMRLVWGTPVGRLLS